MYLQLTTLLLIFPGFVFSQIPVRVTVFYESLCPDSKEFISRQLIPAINAIPTKDLMVELVPFGKASFNATPGGKVDFSCQHGQLECLGNMAHACAIDYLWHDPNLQVAFVACAMRSTDYTDWSLMQHDMTVCSQHLGLDFNRVISCVNSPSGQDLLVQYGDKTIRTIPDLMKAFIPTIIINGVYDRAISDEARTNLIGVIKRFISRPKPGPEPRPRPGPKPQPCEQDCGCDYCGYNYYDYFNQYYCDYFCCDDYC